MVNNLKPGSVGAKVLVEDDEILLIDNKVVGPFKKGDSTTNSDIKTPVTVISQAGQTFEIIVARSTMVRRNTAQFYDQTAMVQVKRVTYFT